jgi:ferredoxin/flavodoxin---NADP+ reductase
LLPKQNSILDHASLQSLLLSNRGEGRVDDLIRKYADGFGYDNTNSVAYACGHPVMVENARAILGRARFTKRQIHTEKYFTLKAP